MARRRFVKIAEAAEILGIGRTKAYADAKRYRETGGAEGLRVVEVGGALRVPLTWLEELAGAPIEPDGNEASVTSLQARRVDTPTARTITPASPRTHSRPPQAQLPFTG